MTQILTITSSPMSEGSVSNDLVARFVGTWRAHDPSAYVTRRDVGLTPPPHLDEPPSVRSTRLTISTARTSEQR